MGSFIGPGVNVAYDASVQVPDLVKIGAKSVRLVLHPEHDVRWYIEQLRAVGIEPIFVVARETLDDQDWYGMLRWYAERYRPYKLKLQIGNEPDHESDSSWDMSGADVNRLHDCAYRAFEQDATYIGPGLVSGDPTWIERSGLGVLRFAALAIHPYAKEPNSPELFDMIAGYRARLAYQNQALLATEYHARTHGMTRFLNDALDGATAFCYTDKMVAGFGLIENESALLDFMEYTKPMPVETPIFQLGFKQWAELEPQVIGAPLENEYGPWLGVSAQRTTRGWLNWASVDGEGKFWFVSDDKVRRRWKPTWSQSEIIVRD